jgi:hypothetical protein
MDADKLILKRLCSAISLFMRPHLYALFLSLPNTPNSRRQKRAVCSRLKKEGRVREDERQVKDLALAERQLRSMWESL